MSGSVGPLLRSRLNELRYNSSMRIDPLPLVALGAFFALIIVAGMVMGLVEQILK